LLALAAGAFAYYNQASRPLDGSAWDVRVKADSFLAFGHSDTLLFNEGRLTSAGCAAKGFAPADYTTAEDGSWQASLAQAGQGMSQWQGTSHGDRIEGTMLQISPSGRVKRYTFKGRRKLTR
jgi:hypothetical protein